MFLLLFLHTGPTKHSIGTQKLCWEITCQWLFSNRYTIEMTFQTYIVASHLNIAEIDGRLKPRFWVEVTSKDPKLTKIHLSIQFRRIQVDNVYFSPHAVNLLLAVNHIDKKTSIGGHFNEVISSPKSRIHCVIALIQYIARIWCEVRPHEPPGRQHPHLNIVLWQIWNPGHSNKCFREISHRIAITELRCLCRGLANSTLIGAWFHSLTRISGSLRFSFPMSSPGFLQKLIGAMCRPEGIFPLFFP